MTKQPHSALDDLMNDPAAARLLKDREALTALLHAPDTQKLMSMLRQTAGSGLQSAADSAARGDPSALLGLVDTLMHSREGAAVVERIQKSAPQK